MAHPLIKVVVGLLTVTSVGVAVTMSNGSSQMSRPQPEPLRAEVVEVVDGRTFDVAFHDQIARVRLAHVGVAHLAAPNQRVNCLAEQASEHLGTLIPLGTELNLTYETDRFGRVTAEATTADGRLVNAEVLRSGLAYWVRNDPAAPVPPLIGAGAEEALRNKRGAHSDDIACTVPGRVKSLIDRVATIPGSPPPGANVVALATAANSATEARMRAEELESAFDQNRQTVTWLALDPAERDHLETQVRAAIARVKKAETALRNATNMLVNHDATSGATIAEANLIAARLAKIRKAEADRAARAASRAAAARKARAEAAAAARARAQAQREAQQQRDAKDDEDPGRNDDESDRPRRKHQRKN